MKTLTKAEARALGITKPVSRMCLQSEVLSLLGMVKTLQRDNIPVAVVCVRGLHGSPSSEVECWRKPGKQFATRDNAKGNTRGLLKRPKKGVL